MCANRRRGLEHDSHCTPQGSPPASQHAVRDTVTLVYARTEKILLATTHELRHHVSLRPRIKYCRSNPVRELMLCNTSSAQNCHI